MAIGKARLTMVRTIALYGAALAAGTVALQWFDYQRIARQQTTELYLLVIAAGFLALGIYIGARMIGGRPAPFDGNPQAQAALGISPRERTVLEALAAGRSNKEIARELGVSPNTVKTHVAHLYEKLKVGRRTEAIARARELGLLQ